MGVDWAHELRPSRHDVLRGAGRNLEFLSVGYAERGISSWTEGEPVEERSGRLG